MVSNMGLWVDDVKDEQGEARSFKSPSHLFLISQFRVREHSLFGSRWSTSVVVSASNESYFYLNG
jgi:hypothetical protein